MRSLARSLAWFGLIYSGILVFTSAYPLNDGNKLGFTILFFGGAAGVLLCVWILCKENDKDDGEASEDNGSD